MSEVDGLLVGFSASESLRFIDTIFCRYLSFVLYYLENAVIPLVEVCLSAGCKVFLNEKNTFWASAATSAVTAGAVVLKPRFADVVVPSAEDSNSRCPDLNLAARVGLLATGMVKNLKARLVADTFAFNRL